VARSPERVNPNMATGAVEVVVTRLDILAEAKTPPFFIEDDSTWTRPCVCAIAMWIFAATHVQNLLLRIRWCSCACYLGERGFVDVETPILTKSTPEGGAISWSRAGCSLGSSTPCHNRRSCSSSCS
jgi:aspartyl-tRNA synthetase